LHEVPHITHSHDVTIPRGRLAARDPAAPPVAPASLPVAPASLPVAPASLPVAPSPPRPARHVQ